MLNIENFTEKLRQKQLTNVQLLYFKNHLLKQPYDKRIKYEKQFRAAMEQLEKNKVLYKGEACDFRKQFYIEN